MSYEPTLTAPSIPRVKFKSSSSGRLWKSCVHRWFSQLQFGTLSVADGFGLSHYGSEGEFQSHMNIKDPAFYKKVALGGSMGAAESYMDGDWECDDLFSLFCLFSKQRALIETMDSSWTRWSRPFLKFGEWLSKNSISGSRKNIAAHYDLGNDFFELFLDQTLTYSSGIFETEQSTLEEASYAKLDRMCRIAELKRGDHVLEIGSGWGSFAIYAASHYGVKVTTITLSKEQKKIAEKRVEKAGLSDSVKVELIDYRHVEGIFDKVVSIEMIEAVGVEYYQTYFEKIHQCLKPGGIAAIQAITVPDHVFEQHLKDTDFIQKYIFPGSKIPSVAALLNAAQQKTTLVMSDLEDLTLDYSKTMQEWRSTFIAKLEDVRAQGYDERFIRMWDYYLNYCAAGFETRYLGTVQMQFRKV